ncbi:FRG domain-containing protein [Marinimicrobium sp. C6131]|uniref:FRG domain-containing protein n=1 Tax=Marinimicrobium sp. C6131 TaxID=3022676 RepID=UPI00223DA21B|nr:FRG domain-containing protein [Marinimicrobium sp. C6131]UZJ44215.1 FRG domain-containing protein [Marinimicrobium sp. C6131]
MDQVRRVLLEKEEDITALYSALEGWLFRGHASSEWSLTSTIERTCNTYGVKSDRIAERERNSLFEFQRRAHHYIEEQPDSTDLLEWAALLQHYGGPTRLVDVTHSLFVAAFFAVENATEDAVVWAFNAGRITPLSEPEGPRKLDSTGIKEANSILWGEKTESGVRLVKPFRLNRRLANQQGAFMMPLSLKEPFESQVASQLDISINNFKDITVKNSLVETSACQAVKIIVPRDIQSRLLRLLSAANVSATTLFGGLDGFARSLKIGFRAFE